MTPPAVAFAGTPEFAVPALRALAASGARIPLVLTQPDRPAGRGRQLAASPVKAEAVRLGLNVAQPVTLRGGSVAEYGPPSDLLIVVAYGLLLPDWMLAWPRRGCVNLHASLLPRWRGAAPIQYALLAGDSQTGVSVMQMERGLDTGPVYCRVTTPIAARESASTLHDRLANLAAEALIEVLPRILDGSLEPTPQDDAHATVAPKIGKADAVLDWRRPALDLDRRVRAFNPWPVAEGRLTDGRRLRIWDAVALAADSGHAAEAGGARHAGGAGEESQAGGAGHAGRAPGAIVAAGPAGIDVATGAGLLRVTRVQPPGARAMEAAAYLAAHSLEGASFAL